jgi:hypothetical protein
MVVISNQQMARYFVDPLYKVLAEHAYFSSGAYLQLSELTLVNSARGRCSAFHL